jgi:CRISPR-associated protein Cmr3
MTSAPIALTEFTWYALEPLDILMFRDARPFNQGEGSWARGTFPPLPITVFQALRAALTHLAEKPADKLRFIGPFLLSDTPEPNTLWLPTPRDLICVQEFQETDPGSSTEPEMDKTVFQWDTIVRFQPMTTADCSWSSSQTMLAMLAMVPPQLKGNQRCCGQPPAWIRASALVRYLQGETDFKPEDFQTDPWDWQVLTHIKMTADTRQVDTDDGYFTEVATRLHPGWKLVAGLEGHSPSSTQPATVTRLGGEGHRVIVSALAKLPDLEELETFTQPSHGDHVAYLLTPGLAQAQPDTATYGVYPHYWQECLQGCISDRLLLWGGISTIQRQQETKPEFALTPQRAHVRPGTVYIFNQEKVPQDTGQLVPPVADSWAKTFESLNYGKLLWGKNKRN